MYMDIKVIDETKFNNSVDIICRQTSYTKEEAIIKLSNNNLDIEKVIKEYLSNDIQSKEKEDKSVNEMIHQQLRSFMKQ